MKMNRTQLTVYLFIFCLSLSFSLRHRCFWISQKVKLATTPMVNGEGVSTAAPAFYAVSTACVPQSAACAKRRWISTDNPLNPRYNSPLLNPLIRSFQCNKQLRSFFYRKKRKKRKEKIEFFHLLKKKKKANEILSNDFLKNWILWMCGFVPRLLHSCLALLYSWFEKQKRKKTKKKKSKKTKNRIIL